MLEWRSSSARVIPGVVWNMYACETIPIALLPAAISADMVVQWNGNMTCSNNSPTVMYCGE